MIYELPGYDEWIFGFGDPDYPERDNRVRREHEPYPGEEDDGLSADDWPLINDLCDEEGTDE